MESNNSNSSSSSNLSLDEQLQELVSKTEKCSISEDFSIPEEEKKKLIEEYISTIKLELSDLQSKFMKSDWTPKRRALIFYIEGKILNNRDKFQKEAEDFLSKAVKLDRTLTNAWNSLGESYWKKADYEAAKRCFEGAIQHSEKPNKVSLRNLSMVLRSLKPPSFDLEKQLIEESLQKAKDSVALDVKDGMSWYILGNAHLAIFFKVSYNSEDTEKALKAYKQAELCGTVHPDLYYNRSIVNIVFGNEEKLIKLFLNKVYKFHEKFQESIDGFLQARKFSPEWTSPLEEILQILNFTQKLCDKITKKDSIKPKKLQQLVQKIPDLPNSVAFSTLKEGKNIGEILVGVIVDLCLTKGFLPITIIVVNKQREYFPISVYNIGENVLKVGDLIQINAPFIKKIHYQVDLSVLFKNSNQLSKQCNYLSVEIYSPHLIVNGKKLNLSEYAPTTIVIEKEPTSKTKK